MEESTRISVTWLELFLDLSVVVAIQKTTSDMEEHLTLLNSVEYAMRMLCIWLAWNLLSLNVNRANKNRSRLKGEIDLSADQWLGWFQTSVLVFASYCFTMMSQSSEDDKNTSFYGFFCLAVISGLLDKLWLYKKTGVPNLRSYRFVGVLSLFAAAVLSFTGYIQTDDAATCLTIFGSLSLSLAVALWKCYCADEDMNEVTAGAGQVVNRLESPLLRATGEERSSGESEGDTSSRTADLVQQVRLLDKAHVEERYGLMVVLLLGESVAVSHPTVKELAPFAVGTAAFATAVLCYGLYFAAVPVGCHRLPLSASPFFVLLYCYLHIALVVALPLLSVGFSILVDQCEARSSHKEDDEKSDQDDDDGDQEGHFDQTMENAGVAMVLASAAGFLLFSGAIGSIGKDPQHSSQHRPYRFSPSQRRVVRTAFGGVLVAVSGAYALARRHAEGRASVGWIIAIAWATPAVLAMSAFVETQKMTHIVEMPP